MDIELKLEGEAMFSSQLELLIKILATQRATVSFLCDKYSNSEEESDKIFKSIMGETDFFASEILKDLYERKGKIEIKDILKEK